MGRFSHSSSLARQASSGTRLPGSIGVLCRFELRLHMEDVREWLKGIGRE